MHGKATAACYAHCRDLVRAADKDRFLATLFAPADRRDHLYALYAFNIEIARVREMVSDALPGEVRLQWWSEALAGCGHGEVGRHPVAAALLETIDRFVLPAETFIDMVEARSFDLYDEPMATVADMEAYAACTSSVPIEMAMAILDCADKAELGSTIRHGGIAYALTGLLRSVGFHAAQGKIYVAEEILARNGVPPHDVLAGRPTPQLAAALDETRAIARGHLARSDFRPPELPATSMPALLPLALVEPYLDRMERPGHDPFSDAFIPQWRRQWILWRAARRCSSGSATRRPRAVA